MIRSFRYCAGTLLLFVFVAATLAGCGRRQVETPAPAPAPPPETTPTTPPPPPPPPKPAPAPDPPPPTEDEIYEKLTPEQIAQKYLADVFFAFDSTELNDQSRAALQKNAEFMKRRTTSRVLVEGHADSRGTSEYNLALGERRAAAVRNYLVGLGVPNERVSIVSKGKEQPFCQEENETCWQQNRRGHFIVTQR